jgi:hypothetical protein
MLLLMMRYVVCCLIYRVSFLSFLHDTINPESLWSAHRSTLSGRLDVDLHVATICCSAPSKTNVLFSAFHVGADDYRHFVARSFMPTDGCSRVRWTIAHSHQDSCSGESPRSVMTSKRIMSSARFVLVSFNSVSRLPSAHLDRLVLLCLCPLTLKACVS